jgi:thiamine biosynthesis lipoprotein
MNPRTGNPVGDPHARLLELGFERAEGPTTQQVTRIDGGLHRLDAERPAMGTRVAIRAIARSPDRLEEAVGRAYAEMDRLITVFTRYESDSALSVLNEAGRLDAPPPELARVLGRADRFHGLTQGAFDVSVAPLVDLFEGCPGTALAPTAPGEAEIAEARERVGARHIRASHRVIRFERDGMRVTLDGIAKGYIVDAMATALEQGGVRHYLVEGGGDIRTRGRSEGGRPWTVAVRDPDRPGSFLDAVRPGHGAVATSGGYERYHAGDRRYHHLVDADSAVSPDGARSVSVVAPSAIDADALATAAFILGPAAGLELIDSMRGCSGLILDRRGQRLTSRGWHSAPLTPDPLE